MVALRFELLGGLTIRSDQGRLVTLRAKKAKALLAFLAMHPNRAQPREKLAGLLWGDNEESQARHNLRQTLLALRKALPRETDRILTIDDESITLRGASVAVDVAQFGELTKNGASAEELNAAIGLYDGDFLDGFRIKQAGFDDWAAEQRRAWRERARQAMHRCMEFCQESGKTDAAIAHGERLLAMDPLQEAVHRSLMRLYQDYGRRDLALQKFEECRKMLRDELDVEPEAETKDLYWAIRRARANGDNGFGLASPNKAAGAATRIADRKLRLRLAPVVASLIFVGLVGAGTWLILSVARSDRDLAIDHDTVLAMPSGPSIAVLPFANIGGDSEQEYFADGITTQVISGLARFRDLAVIARSSTFQYKNKSTDVRQISKDLDARYILEGSVRRSHDRVRVSSQLLDGKTGSHLWTEDYQNDLTAESLLEIQDVIAQQVVATIASHSGVIFNLSRNDTKNASTANYESLNCVHLAYEFTTLFSAESYRSARDCLERVVETDRKYADAWAWLAILYNYGYALNIDPSIESTERGLAAARRAVKLDEVSQNAHFAMALSYYFLHETEAFNAEAEFAIALNPNNADVVAELAEKIAYTGEWERGVALMRKAMALNPRHPSWYWYVLAKHHLMKGNFADAIGAARKVNNPENYIYFIMLAYIYAHAGRQSEAEQAVTAARQVDNDATIKKVTEFYQRWNFQPDFISMVSNGLAKAGLPES